jgi:hypothetical protein
VSAEFFGCGDRLGLPTRWFRADVRFSTFWRWSSRSLAPSDAGAVQRFGVSRLGMRDRCICRRISAAGFQIGAIASWLLLSSGSWSWHVAAVKPFHGLRDLSPVGASLFLVLPGCFSERNLVPLSSRATFLRAGLAHARRWFVEVDPAGRAGSPDNSLAGKSSAEDQFVVLSSYLRTQTIPTRRTTVTAAEMRDC